MKELPNTTKTMEQNVMQFKDNMNRNSLQKFQASQAGQTKSGSHETEIRK